MTRGGFTQKIDRYSSHEVSLLQVCLQIDHHILDIALEYRGEWTHSKCIREDVICRYRSKSDPSGCIEVDPNIGFEWDFLLDPQDAHSMRDIGSPRQDAWTTQYHIVRIEKVLIFMIERSLQCFCMHLSCIFHIPRVLDRYFFFHSSRFRR